MTREAELELEIARLREALKDLYDEFWRTRDWGCLPVVLIKAKLAISTSSTTPPSTTALQELIEKVERRTIERCAEKCETTEIPIDIDFWLGTKKALTAATTIGLAAAIRALPTGNLKLEDL